MFKKLCLLLVLFVSATTLAQTDVFLGLKTGATLSNIRGNEAADKNSFAFNYLVGASVEFGINQHFSAVVNFNYHRKSATRTLKSYEVNSDFNGSLSSKDADVKTTFKYISFPLTLKYKFGTDKSYFINAGGFIDLFSNVALSVDGETVRDDNNDAKKLFQDSDYGTVLGIGKSFKSPNGNQFTLELRNHYGFHSISKIKESQVFTNSWVFSLEYQFNFSAKAI